MVSSMQRTSDDPALLREQIRHAIYDFASTDCFCSATTEELIGTGDSLRRPIRPEDVFLLDFTTPLDASNVLGLGGLIGHRTLLNAYEVGIAWPSTTAAKHDLSSNFYSSETEARSTKARHHLQPFLFKHLDAGNATVLSSADRVAALKDMLHAGLGNLRDDLGKIATRIAGRPDLRDFVNIQDGGLWQSRHTAVQTAVARRSLLSKQCGEILLATSGEAQVAFDRELGEERRVIFADHNYWQFYLSSALGCTNLLHLFANSPRHAAVLTGVFMYYALYCSARNEIVLDRRPNSGMTGSGQSVADLLAKDVQSIADRFGATAVGNVARGFDIARQQWQHFFDDLNAQLAWLANIDRYTNVAQEIMSTIEKTGEKVDLDTFVETLDMCSTTHVHNEHRLVVVESGKMVFWANAGMKLFLDEGEMTLVPIHRLHGSSIETAKCTYHQPVIEPEWLERHGISLDD